MLSNIGPDDTQHSKVDWSIPFGRSSKRSHGIAYEYRLLARALPLLAPDKGRNYSKEIRDIEPKLKIS